MPSEIRSGTAVNVDAVIRAEEVLRRALENGDQPDAVVFHDNYAPGHPDRLKNSETFSLVYEAERDDEEATGSEEVTNVD